MKYFPKEICEKFMKMGCNSDSDQWYACDYGPPYILAGLPCEDCTQAFTPWDFIGTSKQARKNAEILWPGADYVPITYPVAMLAHLAFNTKSVHNYESHRHAAINAPDAMEYIMRFVK